LEGHLTIFSPVVMFMILAMSLPIVPTMIGIFIIRRKVLTLMASQSATMSDKTTRMHVIFMRVLTLQSVLPISFSGAVGGYVVCQTGLACSPIHEHCIMEVSNL
ncbi:hypothetical protein PFISCL1PPCAC_14006, partial [Pristionchus fissidentatus]